MEEIRPEPVAPSRSSRLNLRDILGLVVGFGLASLLARTFVPPPEPAGLVELVVRLVAFAWLGAAMSGPVVLLLDRRGPPPIGGAARSEPASRYSGAEMAWIGIGGYFTAMTLLVVPAKGRVTPWPLILLVQVVAGAILLVWLPIRVRREAARGPDSPRWTRPAAVLLLWTWPFAWIAFALLLR